ncbi:Glutamine cyclotransferase [Corynebacterium capitovis DSM 44611]|uniref:glutaminyl-peptide cyclotransferase n=1 Tax=Corynebacterium capitovis TaxID=131081 RepID=UPI0003A425C7|nr:Glutamine cyclotransferase [Corynebacterium capitovis DSM 44611]
MIDRMGRLAALVSTALLLAACSSPADPGDEPEHLVAVVKDRHPADTGSFTQGLEMAEDGTLYVGTGWVGQSRVYRRTVDGEMLSSRDLDASFFGEGITRAGSSLWQLTWRDGVAIQRDADSLEETARVPLSGEGWGACSRGDEVVVSDGSNELRRMDPETLTERSRFEVTRAGQPVTGLNELECVHDDIYANIFLTTDIVRIDATTGVVTAVIDASGVPNNAAPDPNNVLNGIAKIPGTDEFFLTGKRWPDLYTVTFEPED